jgi:hypothetical protein
MAANATNLVQAEALDASAMTSATVGGATASIPTVTDSFPKGIDGATNCQQLANDETALTSGAHHSAWVSFGASRYDVSGVDQAFCVHWKNNAPSFNSIAENSDSIWVILFSGGGTTNYGRWHYDPTNMKDGAFYPIMMTGTPDATGGTFDDTDVSGFGIAIEASNTDTYGFQMSIDQLIYIDGPVVFEDTGTAATVTLEDYYDLLKPTSGTTYHSMLVARAGPTIEFGFPIDFQCDDYDDTSVALGIAFKENDGNGFPAMASGYYQCLFTPPASSTLVFENASIATNSTDFDLTIDASAASCSLTFTSCLFAGVNDAVIGGSGVTMTGCTLASPATCDISDGDLELTINDCTAAINWSADLATGSTITTDSDIDITFTETDLSDINVVLTASTELAVNPTTGSGTYDLSLLTTTGTVTLDNDTANNTTITLASGTSNTVASPTNGGGSITVDSPAVTFTFGSDTASTLIRYFEDDSQTVVDSTTGTSLAYEYPDADPVDAEFLRQGYVPVNRQDIVPSDGGTLDIIMDFDEAYNSSHGLVITTDYTYNRATKALSIVADQEALDVRSALADLIRTNSSYYNTPLLMVAIPGLTRVDLTDGMTISSMATWKGAGMERFDSADSANPLEKWFAIKSVGTITGATVHYRQTSSGDSTAVTLTNNVVNEAFQYYRDDNHDGDTSDTNEYDYSGYMVIKSFLAGSKQGRVDVPANAGLSTLASNLYTVPLSNAAHDYAGTDPGITADITLVTGSTVGGVAFAYEIVDGGTNTGENIADQLNYNAANNPNTVIPGGTGLRYFELPDMVIHNASSVETERGYREGATPALVGFYVSRGGSDHPSFTRFQGDNGDYYTPTDTVLWTAPNFLNDTRVRLYNVTQATEIDNSTISGGGGYSYTLTPGSDFDSGDQITMLATYQSGGTAKQVFRFSTTVTTADVTISDSQVDWDNPGPNTLGIDGSTVSECATDYAGVQVEVTDSDDTTQKSRIAAFIVDALTTADGIRNWVGLDGSSVITYSSNAAAQIDASVASVEVINQKTTSTLSVKDSFEFDWSDGVDRVSAVSGSSIIWLAPDRVLLEETGVSGLTGTESSQLALIATVDGNVDLLVQDQGLDSGNPKTITENTEGTSYDESFGSVTKEIRRSGDTTTITRTA